MSNLFNRKSYRPLQSSPQRQEQASPNTSESELISAPANAQPGATAESAEQQSGSTQLFATDEVVRLLQVKPAQLETWVQIFRASLSEYTRGYNPRFGPDDVSTLFFIGNLADSGYSNDQISDQLLERRTKLANKEYAEIEIISTEEVPSIPLENNVTFRERVPDYHPDPTVPNVPDSIAPNGNGYPLDETSQSGPTPNNAIQNHAEGNSAGLVNRQVNDLLSTVADSQQSVLNIQDSMRETIGVVVQDNFNLKHENRKLRDRMLEIERSLSEQQRREETRKEIFEGRLRAVEGTLAAMQQQLAQIIQFQRGRGPSRRKGWFR